MATIPKLPNPFALRKSGLIGYARLEKFDWSGTDEEALFKSNLEKYPNHADLLRYKSDPIRYEYNTQGHRTNDVVAITTSKKPYILVTGCSFTEGLGLHRHETYAEQLGRKVGLPVYNLGLAGTGIDVMLHNLIAWKEFIRIPPKILVVQWSQAARTCQMDNEGSILGSVFHHNSSQAISNYIDGGIEEGLFETRARLADTLINLCYKTSEIINVHIPSWETDSYGTARKIVWRPQSVAPNFARDLMHAGSNNHQELADRILKSLS